MANYRRIFENGYSYFITIVTHRRNPILLQNIDLLREAFRDAKKRYDFRIDAVVILPDHLHMILTPEKAEDYPQIVGHVKRYFSRHCDPHHYEHLAQSSSRKTRGYKPVWQKRYFEHCLRDENDYQRHLDYIHYNPVKHGLASRAHDWEHSSFHRYVAGGWYPEDWCDLSDELDLE